jgi:hypothetical protein
LSISSVNLGRQHFTRHGQHINIRGKEIMSQQIGEMVQWNLRTVDYATPHNVIPLDYKEVSVHETRKPKERKGKDCT